MLLEITFTALLFTPQQDPSWATLDRAYQQLRLKDYDQAIVNFRRALLLNPSRVTVFKDLAYALLKTGETEQAVEAFEAHHKAVPGDYQTIMELGYLYVQVKKEDQALAFFRQAMNSPDAAQAAQARQAFDNVGGPILAEIARWSAAIQQDANNVDARESLADAYVRHGDASNAIAQYHWLRENAPTRYRHLITLSELHAKLALTLAGTHPDVARAYALLAMRSPDPRVAAQGRGLFGERYPYLYELELAVQLEPWQQEIAQEVAYLKRGVAPPAPPPPAPADDSLQHHDSAQHHRDLGYASLAKSFLPTAAREFEIVRRLDPKDDLAALQLGSLYTILMQYPASIRWFKLARPGGDDKTSAQAK